MHSVLDMYAQPEFLQLFRPLQELLGVAHSLEPLQALEPAHFTKASWDSPHMLEQPVANNAAAAAAIAIAFLDVRFILETLLNVQWLALVLNVCLVNLLYHKQTLIKSRRSLNEYDNIIEILQVNGKYFSKNEKNIGWIAIGMLKCGFLGLGGCALYFCCYRSLIE